MAVKPHAGPEKTDENEPFEGGDSAADEAGAAFPAALLGFVMAAAPLVWTWWLGTEWHGIYVPDEIYQSIEPAHRLVFGYGLVPWEFEEGARHWTFPGLLAAPMALLKAIGLDAPRTYLGVISGLMCTGVMLAAAGVYHWLRRLEVETWPATAATVGFAASLPVLYFAPRALTEVASLAPIAWGFALAATPKSSRVETGVGMALACFAVFLRLQNGILAAGLLVLILLARDPERRRWALGAVAASVVLFAGIDWWTWGEPFASASNHVAYNLKFATFDFRVQHGPFYYLVHLWEAGGVAMTLALLLALVGARRARGTAAVAAIGLLFFSVIVNKQFRFILPFFPLLFVLAGCGLQSVRERTGRTTSDLLAAAILLTTAISGARLTDVTLGELGQAEHLMQPAERNAWSFMHDVNALMLRAHDHRELCGLKVEAPRLLIGGASYLHRDVPIYGSKRPTSKDGQFNFLITGPEEGEHLWRREEKLDRAALFRLPVEDCATDPDYTEQLDYGDKK